MRTHVWSAVLAIVIWFGLAPPAAAQQRAGLRAGVSSDPTQFYFGGHFDTAPLVDRLTFRPNVEVGVGDNLTLLAFNLEFTYRIPINQQPWTVYFGGGPAVNWYSYRSDHPRHGSGSDVEGGFNVLIGAEHGGGLFTELKVGMIDSPSVKFGVGYNFGR